MSYCTLEEAWGSDFKKKYKKSKKERRLEHQEKKILSEAVDPQILVPPSQPRSADSRKSATQMLQGYDNSFDRYMSPYQQYTRDPVATTNQTVRDSASMQSFENPLQTKTHPPVNNMVTLSQEEYNQLKQRPSIEGFTASSTSTDDEFNKLLLYIFTGIFYLFTMDLMYQLGKKSFS